jgi:hypothetical protein
MTIHSSYGARVIRKLEREGMSQAEAALATGSRSRVCATCATALAPGLSSISRGHHRKPASARQAIATFRHRGSSTITKRAST